jgi:hypothetical protein
MTDWAQLVQDNARPARSNVEVQTQLLGELEGSPAEVAERLVGVDGATAEALFILGAEACDLLLTRLAAAVQNGAPVLTDPPEDTVAAQVALTVASCWNDILAAGRPELLAGDEPTSAWLDGVDAADPELERQLAFVVPALGRDTTLRELVNAGTTNAPVAQPEDIGPVLAAAVLGEDTIEAEWREWLASAPKWLSSGMLEWQDLLWAARAVYARIGGEPVERVLPALRRATRGE